MYSSDRNIYRQAYFTAWQKHKKNLPLEPIEAQMVDIIIGHPEYHALLESAAALSKQEFTLEENPFFHMSLHMAVRDQVKTDKPPGMTLLYTQLLLKNPDVHALEHQIITCLAQTLWQAHQDNSAPNEEEYLKKLRDL